MKTLIVRIATVVFLMMIASLTAMIQGCGGGSGRSETRVTPEPQPPPAPRYKFTALVGDSAGIAPFTDRMLVNPWGMAFGTSGPFLIANKNTSVVTVYQGDNAKPLPSGFEVTGGPPTGIVFNRTNDFMLSNGTRALALLATEDGTLSGSDGGTAIVAVNRAPSGAVYKGLALAKNGNQNLLVATDFHNGRMDRFDGGFHLLGSFTDPDIPAGFAPFGIQTINGLLYVTFARQKGQDSREDAPGAGNGYLDVFRSDGTLVKRLISQSPLNSPWGIALAPGGFGAFAGKLLVGNVGDGRINAFDPNTGAFVGALQGMDGQPLVVPGLQAISFGDGGTVRRPDTLYITAGGPNRTHGLFGAVSVQ